MNGIEAREKLNEYRMQMNMHAGPRACLESRLQFIQAILHFLLFGPDNEEVSSFAVVFVLFVEVLLTEIQERRKSL